MQSGEFGLQVRLPQTFGFNHLQNAGSRCDAGVTRFGSSNDISDALGLSSLMPFSSDSGPIQIEDLSEAHPVLDLHSP
jgi:hypothetical protein